jgi:hypothetical protein
MIPSKNLYHNKMEQEMEGLSTADMGQIMKILAKLGPFGEREARSNYGFQGRKMGNKAAKLRKQAYKNMVSLRNKG